MLPRNHRNTSWSRIPPFWSDLCQLRRPPVTSPQLFIPLRLSPSHVGQMHIPCLSFAGHIYVQPSQTNSQLSKTPRPFQVTIRALLSSAPSTNPATTHPLRSTPRLADIKSSITYPDLGRGEPRIHACVMDVQIIL